MIDNRELPIGLTMELARHSDILTRFSEMPKTEQQSIIDRARNVRSRDEMRNLVESII